MSKKRVRVDKIIKALALNRDWAISRGMPDSLWGRIGWGYYKTKPFGTLVYIVADKELVRTIWRPRINLASRAAWKYANRLEKKIGFLEGDR